LTADSSTKKSRWINTDFGVESQWIGERENQIRRIKP